MKSILKSFLLMLALLVSAPVAVGAVDLNTGVTFVLSAPEKTRKPVMVIRFDGPYTEYEKSLSMVVRSAVQKKKDVIFDVAAGGQAQSEGGQVVNSEAIKIMKLAS